MISEVSWSLLDPKPVLARVEKYDATLCFWNGVVTTKKYGLILQAGVWNNISPTVSMKHAAWSEFIRLYGLGAFGSYNWDNFFKIKATESTHHTYLASRITANNPQFFTNLKQQYSAAEALGWFMNNKQIILVNDSNEYTKEVAPF